MQNASTVAKWSRDLHCIFIERNIEYARNLREVLSREAPLSLNYDIKEGDVEERLDEALILAGDSPLLGFLDPFGTALPYHQTVDKLILRGPKLKTEVLLNLNLEMVWRIGGYLTGEETDEEQKSGRSETLVRVDRFLGGNWWREIFQQARVSGVPGSAAAAAQQVAAEFCKRIKNATGFDSFSVPIRSRPTHPPLFLMILFYRHPAAPYQFNDSVSGANSDWRTHFRQLDLAEELAKQQDTPDLFGIDFVVEMSEKDAKAAEDKLDQAWSEIIAANIRSAIADQPTLPIEARFADIYGSTMGLAREKHLRAAWDHLSREGIVRVRNKSEKRLRKLTIVRS